MFRYTALGETIFYASSEILTAIDIRKGQRNQLRRKQKPYTDIDNDLKTLREMKSVVKSLYEACESNKVVILILNTSRRYLSL